jgi:hypothetical protein
LLLCQNFVIIQPTRQVKNEEGGVVRKEGVIILGIGLLLLVLAANYYHIFNALTLFLLAGGIPGTKLFLPDSFMPLLTLVMLVALMAWLLRNSFAHRFLGLKKLGDQSQSKQPEL